MAKKEGRISLSRLLRESDEKQRRKQLEVLLFAIIAAIIILVSVPFFLQSPAYEFKTGVNHPQEIRDLIGRGTVVLLFTHDDCLACMNGVQIMVDLQSQYNSTDVTFATFNIYDNTTTSPKMFNDYGIDFVPQIFVIRGDGAVAKFTDKFADTSPIKSAIEDAQNWQQSHPTQNV